MDLYDIAIAKKLSSSGGGGGGSSDFSTAKLTLVGAPIDPIYVPVAVEMPMEEPLYTTYPRLQGEGGTFDVVLYKGSAILTTIQSITISGNIQSIADNYYLITGDCTVAVQVS